MGIKISSSAFTEGGLIPLKYTCDGEDVSPPLKWDSVPDKTQSIALICDDPDAPMGTFVHWVLYNLPAETRELPENMPRDGALSNGTRQAPAISAGSAMAAPARPVERTAITSKSTPWTPKSTQIVPGSKKTTFSRP